MTGAALVEARLDRLEDWCGLRLGSELPWPLRPDVVVKRAAALWCVTELQIKGPCRRRDIVHARAAVVLVLRRNTALSFPSIGRLLGRRDHTTIINLNRLAVAQIEQSPSFADAVAAIERAIAPLKGNVQ